MKLDGKHLAINGGSPVRTKPWLDNFTTGEEEKRAVIETMESGYLSLFEGSHTPDAPFSFFGGPRVQALEQAWRTYYDIRFAASMNSATSGLYAAIGALGLGYGDEVIVSPYTMSACAACALVYGAIPVFADVDINSGALLPASIEANLTPRTKAIVVVHQFGIPADMDAIMAIAVKHGLKVIEDCAQAHGAKYRGKFVGTIGDIGVFSLNVNKTIQTGEGCVCTTNDPDLHYRLCLIRNHGEAVVGPAGYENIINMIGFNYRLTEIQAAIAIEQLKKLDLFNEVRIEYVNRLADFLAPYDRFRPLIRCPCKRNGNDCIGDMKCKSTYYVFPVRYIAAQGEPNRDEVVKALRAEGAIFYQGYVKPLYFQPVYQRRLAFKHGYPFSASENRGSRMNYAQGTCINAEKLHFEQMLINEHVRLPQTHKDIGDLILSLKKLLEPIT